MLVLIGLLVPKLVPGGREGPAYQYSMELELERFLMKTVVEAITL